jgi:hypothetical protein
MKPNPKRKPGRPRNSTPVLPIYDSMDQCEAHTGITKEVQQRMKKDGCLAFRGNSVHLADLLAWVKIHYKLEPKNGERSQDEQERELDIKLKRQKFEERDGILVEFAEALSMAQEVLMPLRQKLLGLASTMCAKCNPTDPHHSREALENWTEETMKLLADAERAKIRRA